MAFARGGPMRLGGVHFWLSPPQSELRVGSSSAQKCLVTTSAGFSAPATLRLALEPQISNMQVPKLAQASAAYDDNGSTGVRVDCNFDCDAKVCEERHPPQALARSLGESVKFRLSARQRHCCLRT